MSNATLRVALVALDIAPGQPEVNLAAVSDILSRLPSDTDLVMLPELFSTGLTHTMSVLAQPMSGDTISTIRELARKYDMAVCGTFAAKIGAWMYNRAFLIEPSGEDTTYDKHHLFCLSRESKVFRPGDDTQPPVARFRGFDLALGVCYDLRFPVWCRIRPSRPYDAMLLPANWPEARVWAWQSLLTARAIENQAYYLGCNRSGCDGFGDYPVEMTQAYNPLGQPIGTTSPQLPGVVFATLQHKEVDDIRTSLPFLRDADPFTVH